jgi:hypothetical protein
MNSSRISDLGFEMNQIRELEWLIIGGGVHGTHLSHVLVNELNFPSDRVVVLDPYEWPMWRWNHCTTNTSMSHLRSPAVHHIGLEPMDLLHFARSDGGRKESGFRPPYDRPSLALFQAHCRHVCEEGGLYDMRSRGTARHISRSGSLFCVDSDKGALKTRRIIVATGMGDKPRWPKWARQLRAPGAPTWHIFDDEFQHHMLDDFRRIAVIGLGISGAQLATHLAKRADREVHVVARHDVRIEQFDSDPCWLGPKCQISLRRRTCLQTRRKMIDEARQSGTMPGDVARPFLQMEQWDRINLHRSGCEAAFYADPDEIHLELGDGERIAVDAVVLATGFEAPRPDRTWLASTIEELGLSCAHCGFPIVDDHLQWTSDFFVSGSLAELELGPAARNIAGARMTARRIRRAAA